jgi:preprotein translocase subunit SecD
LDLPRIAAEEEQAAHRRLDYPEIVGARTRIVQDLRVLRLPGTAPESAVGVKGLFRMRGHLELRGVAPPSGPKQFNEEKIVLEGNRVAENSSPARGGAYEAYGARILVGVQLAPERRHRIQADPRQEITVSGNCWLTAVKLDTEGAKRFDEIAEKPYNQGPPGLFAILFDGVLKTLPAVQSSVFHSRGQHSDAKSGEEAKDLAIMLRTGALPVQLGEPELERTFGPKN